MCKLNFNKVDFVIEAGQYSIRGGIFDIYSYADEHPYRIEFFDDEIESIRTFNVNNQQFKFGRFQTKIVDVTNFKNVNIISDCKLLRPYIFKYNHGFIDVHHA